MNTTQIIALACCITLTIFTVFTVFNIIIEYYTCKPVINTSTPSLTFREYRITLSLEFDNDLNHLAYDLNMPKEEVFRKALILFLTAAKAKNVKLEHEDGTSQYVLIK